MFTLRLTAPYMLSHASAEHSASSIAALSTHFFLPPAPPPSSLRSHEITLPSITTPLPSMNATRERPSQFLKVSQTKGCCGWKLHCAISFDFSECGSSIFLPPVSLPIFHLSLEIRHAERPQRTNPIGEYPTLMLRPTLSPGLAKSTRLWCISTVKTLPVQGFELVCVGKKTTSSPGFTMPCSTRPASTSPTPLIL